MRPNPDPKGPVRAAFAVALFGTIPVLFGCDDLPSAPDLGDFPTGSYTVSFDESEAENPAIVGTWEMIWGTDGELLVVFDGNPFVRSSFSVAGDRVTLRDIDGAGACVGTGTYTWALDDPDLIFATVSDDCEGRRVVLTTKPWPPS